MGRDPIAFGSGNVFQDLGVVDAEEHLAKADLVAKIASIVEERRLSEAEVIGVTGISRSEVAALLKGRCRDFSGEELDRLLHRLKTAVA